MWYYFVLSYQLNFEYNRRTKLISGKLPGKLHATRLKEMWSIKYCSSVSLRLYCKFVPTNESPIKITLMNRVDQSQLRFLGIAPPSHHPCPLNCRMLTTSFPKGNGRGKNSLLGCLEVP